jgi:Rap1a immunity proteins
MKRGLIIAAALAILGASNAYSQENLFSGNKLINGCRALTEPERLKPAIIFETGICNGIFHSLKYVQTHLFCIPDGVTNMQMHKLIVKYMDEHPELLHRDLLQIAVAALGTTWPCKQ